MASDRTEKPTKRRLERARREGDVVVSNGLIAAGAILAAALWAPSLARAVTSEFTSRLEAVVTQPALAVRPGWMVASLLALLVPFLVLVSAGATIAGFSQSRTVAPRRIAPDLARLDPARGARALASRLRALDGAPGALVALAIIAGAVWLLTESASGIADATDPARALAATETLSLRLVRIAALGLVAGGALGYALSFRAWLERLHMTRREVLEEQRQAEGDPHARAARRRAREELLLEAALEAVDSAALVVTGDGTAAALRYAGDGHAPVVVARGRGARARAIAERARVQRIPSEHDPALAAQLSRAPEGHPIARALYDAVARAFASRGASPPGTQR